jgi:AraC-like DNA-binding protein
VIYEEHPPSHPDLHDTVACFWRFVSPESLLHVVPPDGLVNITWLPVQRFAVVVGPRMQALRVPVSGGCEYRGLKLRPGVVDSVLGVGAPALRGQNLPLRFCAPQIPAPREPFALEDWVRAWPPRKLQDPRPLAWIDALLQDPDRSIAELAAASELSYRQMLRLFYAAVGLTPKEFARLRKFRAACVQAVARDAASWAAISLESGYADQSHLTREFSQVFGWPPRLIQEYLRRIEHRLLG